MKCQDEHALLSALSSTGKISGISHLEQPAKLAVLSITPNGRGFVFFSVDFERILMGQQHKVKTLSRWELYMEYVDIYVQIFTFHLSL